MLSGLMCNRSSSPSSCMPHHRSNKWRESFRLSNSRVPHVWTSYASTCWRTTTLRLRRDFECTTCGTSVRGRPRKLFGKSSLWGSRRLRRQQSNAKSRIQRKRVRQDTVSFAEIFVVVITPTPTSKRLRPEVRNRSPYRWRRCLVLDCNYSHIYTMAGPIIINREHLSRCMNSAQK